MYQWQVLITLLGASQKTKIHTCHPDVGGPRSVPCQLSSFLSLSSYHLRSDVTEGFTVMIVTSAPCSFNPCILSSTELPKLGPVLDCESLNLLLSGTGWRVHDDNWGGHQSSYRGRSVQAYSPLLLGVMWVLWIKISPHDQCYLP